LNNNIAQIIENIGADFPNGKYWNHNPVDGNDPTSVTNTACTHSNHDVYGVCGCNSYGGAIQCQGFALYLANRVFGSYPSIHGLDHQNMNCGNGWYAYAKESYANADQRFYDVDIEPGDIIITPSHTAMVWCIDDSDIVQVIEVWGSEGCMIHHGNYNGNLEGVPTVSHVKSIANYIVKSPGTTPTPTTTTIDLYRNHNPNDQTKLTHTYTVGSTGVIQSLANRDGYEFAGWYTSATGGTRVERYNQIGDATALYAAWKRLIKFYMNDGTNNYEERYIIEYHNYGSGVLTAPGTTRTGYTFDGWYVSVDGGAEDKIYGDYVPHTWTTALYAHWTPNTVRVILENYNGSGGAKIVTETYGEKYKNLSTADVGVFDHIGWFDSTGKEYTANTTVTSTNVHSIKAHWRWTVSLYRNNGTANENPINLSVSTGTKYGTLLNFAANSISKPGYTFAGWYTSATGGTRIESTTDVRDGVTALYAHWTPNN